ncbi:hypothetical protein SAMN06265171_1122 [Chryseobacterium rhizoplanae]|uniref:Uncharacterized protein n=1 Tax=Chryseobacterium rhizoplanae TaxID=1609531 RepID=A0A521F615_9FLAO|nr:hypothetical protein [Chryseobacterium rhizoplanae]SMO91658.1 hypothetical protein SAMN06265171_1122 [Chryseobacterium rhizoplanae]
MHRKFKAAKTSLFRKVEFVQLFLKAVPLFITFTILIIMIKLHDKKIVLSLLLLVVGYFFYNPMIISLAAIKDPESINFKPDQVFKLKDIPELKNSQNTVLYILFHPVRIEKISAHKFQNGKFYKQAMQL